jgi:glycosyltransferase involved in cell wall biosynthesis
MRILILHSGYLSGWASGENTVVRDEERLLTEAGHEVVGWTPAPEPSLSHARLGARALWSPAAQAHVRRLIASHRPEIVHVHNLFPMLSPAVLRAGAVSGANVVVTLHNYRMLCLPATCFRDGEVCELCVGHVPWRGVAYRCYRGSAAGSAALAAALTIHRAIRTFDHVSLFLAVSTSVRDKHLEAGFTPERIVVKPNFSWPRTRREGAGDYFLYAGRIAPEKDVGVLLEAWGSVSAPLIVVGDGPQMNVMRAMAPPGVDFRGTVPPDEVSELLLGARALLLPSRWHEPNPRSVLEAYSAGVPVIASAIGGLTEMVEDQVSGMLVRSRSPDAWLEVLGSLMDDATSQRLGEGAFDLWRREYGPDKGLERLEAAYRAAGDQI